jgi:hypothetical protein
VLDTKEGEEKGGQISQVLRQPLQDHDREGLTVASGPIGQLMARDRQIEGFCELPVEATESGRRPLQVDGAVRVCGRHSHGDRSTSARPAPVQAPSGLEA